MKSYKVLLLKSYTKPKYERGLMKRLVAKITLSAFTLLIPVMAIAAETDATVAAKEEKVAVLSVTPALAKPSKIGYIDLSYIGMESEFGKSIKVLLNEQKGKAEGRILAEKKKLDTLKDSIESKLPTYTPKQREAKSKEFQKKVEAFQKMARESEESFMKEQDIETGKIFTLIEKSVSDYAKSNDFAIIVNKKDFHYVDRGIETHDLTSIILKAVDDAWKKK